MKATQCRPTKVTKLYLFPVLQITKIRGCIYSLSSKQANALFQLFHGLQIRQLRGFTYSPCSPNQTNTLFYLLPVLQIRHKRRSRTKSFKPLPNNEQKPRETHTCSCWFRIFRYATPSVMIKAQNVVYKYYNTIWCYAPTQFDC